MASDLDIARQTPLRPIATLLDALQVPRSRSQAYGDHIAKVDPRLLGDPRPRPGSGRLILVTAITPTPAGEGKTTTTIGLGQGLARLGESVVIALREPSLGPAFGMKGGATGGGYSQVLPRDRINLHFTGDFHAITSAHNLLAALVDHHLHTGNDLEMDPERITWPRVMDMNDRSLRQIIVGLGAGNGVERHTGFDITAASEVMAMLCLANDQEDLRQRLARTVVAYGKDGRGVTAHQLGATGAMLALLRDALWPNLVQTVEGVPALIHGGPFANIAHGCNSVIATRTALHLADWAVTEAGFGSDLGAEKFFHIKCRSAGLDPTVVVLVATIRALKLHGGAAKGDLETEDTERVRSGLPNLQKHIENMRAFGRPPVVALNRFPADTEREIQVVREACGALEVPFALAEHHARGGAGAEALAQCVMEQSRRTQGPFQPLYKPTDSVEEKVSAVARTLYGADSVVFEEAAVQDLERIRRLGADHLPICMAKTPASLSDDPKRTGRPTGFQIRVRRIQLNTGAGFLVMLTGEILRMPGLPKTPLVNRVDLRGDEIIGLS